MKCFDGKVALLTDSRSGIGEAISRRFHEDTSERIIEKVIGRRGRLDAVINNAGMTTQLGLP